jgi:hypothetical protein
MVGELNGVPALQECGMMASLSPLHVYPKKPIIRFRSTPLLRHRLRAVNRLMHPEGCHS